MQPLQQGLEAAAYSQSPMYQPSVTNPLLLQGLVLHLLLRLDSGTTGSSCGVTPWVACDYPLLKATWRPSMVSTISEQHSKDIEERTSLCLVLLPCASCRDQCTPKQRLSECLPPSQLPPCSLPCSPSSLATSLHLLLETSLGWTLLRKSPYHLQPKNSLFWTILRNHCFAAVLHQCCFILSALLALIHCRKFRIFLIPTCNILHLFAKATFHALPLPPHVHSPCS